MAPLRRSRRRPGVYTPGYMTGERANRQNENCPPAAYEIDRARTPAVIAGGQEN
jgi:hypothetical protein